MLHWDFRKLRRHECSARAMTTSRGDELIVMKGPDDSPHSDTPDPEEAEAEIAKRGIKRTAEEHPDLPPAHVTLKHKYFSAPG